MSLYPGRVDQIDDGEDDDPDDVDEVPVETYQLEVHPVVLREAALETGDAPQGEEHDDPDGDVGAVEAGEYVEGRRHRVGGQLHVVVHDELGELEDLPGQEHRAQRRGGEQPCTGLALVVTGEGIVGQHHGQRAHEQHERADRGEGDVVDLGRIDAEPG